MGRHSRERGQRDDPGLRLDRVVVGAGLVWVLGLALGLLGPLADYTFLVLGTGAVVAALVSVSRQRPQVRWPSVLIATALVVFLVGGSVREVLGTLGDLSSRRSLIPDLITIPGYVMIGLALLGIARARRQGRRDVDGMLDGVVASLAAMTLAWIYLVNPALFHAHAPLAVRLLLSCYPPLSVFLVAITARLHFTGGMRGVPAYQLVLAAVGALLVGDVVYMLIDTHVMTLPKHVFEVPYALAYVAMIGALLHPSMHKLTDPMPGDEASPTSGRPAFVAIALGIPGLITVTRVDAKIGDRIALGVIIMSLTAAATLRVFRALRAYARSEARLAHQATHDALTGLPNRAYVHEYVRPILARAKQQESVFVALFFLDVDRFKLVNDSHGHGLGDELLLAIARRLRATTRSSDLVARIGGDEFVIVVEGLRGAKEAIEVAERTRASFDAPFRVRGAEIVSSASIGVSLADGTDPKVDAEALIRDADTAMYEAKEAGRDAVTVFNASMRERASLRLALERELRHALERHELQLHYQPIVDLPSGRVAGFEALLRWLHPTRGQISPVSFIPVAEDTGLIVPIGGWVIDEACRQLARWRRVIPKGERLYVSVNLSARQLRDPELTSRVQHALDSQELSRDSLCLELTESLVMSNPAAAAELLKHIRSLGVRLLIDDFGTGYSSLSHLRRLPVDQVKIDQCFVAGLDRDDTSDESLIAAIVAMASALQVTTIAEGVETQAQADRLHDIGCDVAQGYLFSAAVAPGHIPEVVERLGVAGVPSLHVVSDSSLA